MADQTSRHAALRDDLQKAVSPHAAFFRAGEARGGEAPRYDIGLGGVLEAAQHLYVVLTTGFVGVVLSEVAKGALEEIGPALGKKLVDFVSRWFNKTETHAPAALDDASDVLAEAKRVLTEVQFANALAAGRIALQARLVQDGFPPRRAESLAQAITDIAHKDTE